jgi:hypothetical protein
VGQDEDVRVGQWVRLALIPERLLLFDPSSGDNLSLRD